MRDVIIAVSGSIGTALVFGLGAVMVKLWRTPKRIARLETAVVPVTYGVWALLRIHINEKNGGTDPDVRAAYDDLTKIVTQAVVSQKGH